MMGRLRCKVDWPNEAPMIRNVRGLGFVLDATPLSYGPPKKHNDEVASSSLGSGCRIGPSGCNAAAHQALGSIVGKGGAACEN